MIEWPAAVLLHPSFTQEVSEQIDAMGLSDEETKAFCSTFLALHPDGLWGVGGHILYAYHDPRALYGTVSK